MDSALVRKYLAQHPGEKMDFALSPVHPGTTINPAFPLVKVGNDDFQLIPREIMMQKMQEEQKRLGTKSLAPIQPKPDEVPPELPTTTATVTTSRWRTNAIGEPELVDDISIENEGKIVSSKISIVRPFLDGEPKKISLRTLSASSTGSPVKPVTDVGITHRNENHSESEDDVNNKKMNSDIAPTAMHISRSHPPPSATNHGSASAPTVVPPPSTELAILPSTTATVTPGNIANQIHNRHKRQPPITPRRKERPKKPKKVKLKFISCTVRVARNTATYHTRA